MCARCTAPRDKCASHGMDRTTSESTQELWYWSRVGCLEFVDSRQNQHPINNSADAINVSSIALNFNRPRPTHFLGTTCRNHPCSPDIGSKSGDSPGLIGEKTHEDQDVPTNPVRAK